MQPVISQIAFSFVDDAFALTDGAVRIVRDLTIEGLLAIRRKLLAPVDRLARSCDVGGVMARREATLKRARAINMRRLSAPRSWRDRLNIFRGLQDLT